MHIIKKLTRNISCNASSPCKFAQMSHSHIHNQVLKTMVSVSDPFNFAIPYSTCTVSIVVVVVVTSPHIFITAISVLAFSDYFKTKIQCMICSWFL